MNHSFEKSEMELFLEQYNNTLWTPTIQDNAENGESDILQTDFHSKPCLDVENMLQCQQILNQYPQTEQNEYYKEITQQIAAYIERYCPHHIIDDFIDITPDYGCRIRYCEYCEMTFPNN